MTLSILILISVVSTLLFWVWPIVLIMLSSESEFDQPTDRVLWFILVFFLPPIGEILYLVMYKLSLFSDSQSISSNFSSKTYQATDLKRAGD